MGFEIIKPIKNLAGGALDANRGPYLTTAAACLAIPNIVVEGVNFREGKQVDIGTGGVYKVYWWQGGFQDINLVEMIVKGEKGENGKSFKPDATGIESERSLYDTEDIGFAFLATDTKLIYWRNSTGWSLGVPFGGTGNVEPTFLPIVLELTDEEVVVDWNVDLIEKHGTRPTDIELWETTIEIIGSGPDAEVKKRLIKSTSPPYSEDDGATYRFYVGTIESPRTWEVRIFGYTEAELPNPPIPTAPPAPTNGESDTENYEFSFDQVTV